MCVFEGLLELASSGGKKSSFQMTTPESEMDLSICIRSIKIILPSSVHLMVRITAEERRGREGGRD